MYTSLYQDKNSAYFNHSRPEMLEFIPAGIKNALDVGCGTGNFGMLVKSAFNCSVWGIEPDPASAKEAGTRLDHVINDTFNRSMKEMQLPKFDCVFFNDVLEHLAEPENALLLAKDLLNEGGYIVASIPNMRWYPVILQLLRYKDFEYQNSGVMDKTHLRFFTEKSMARMFKDAGFTIKTIKGINKSNFRFLNILNVLLFNKLADMKYLQFGMAAFISNK
ncbi:class I SAM-dependent methyltransferase [Mucilaginibacter sp.]|uniref:class I SAM-dependent methyltransferase n=1 Tax=Mucilaginibacter sp. TaxID=1882438 RepID=UPI0026059B75|nr:class I SAM-dependent methyltransferase [Mucilaginibacter sp.]